LTDTLPAKDVTVRDATMDDLDRIIEMATRFVAETTYRDRIANNPAAMRALAEGLLANDASICLLAEQGGRVVGMFGGIVYAHHISGERIAGEVCWWVDPESRGSSAGLRLLREAERMAAARGAGAMQMIAPTDHVAKIYRSLGYEFVEATYQRSL